MSATPIISETVLRIRAERATRAICNTAAEIADNCVVTGITRMLGKQTYVAYIVITCDVVANIVGVI